MVRRKLVLIGTNLCCWSRCGIIAIAKIENNLITEDIKDKH